VKHPSPPAAVPLVYSPNYSIPWEAKHRFPMAKYRLLYERLIDLGIATQKNTYISSPCTRPSLSLAHADAYIEAFIEGSLSPQQLKEIGLNWTEKLVTRTLTAVGGTVLTCKLALVYGLACHLAGGTHHAFAAKGQGFCVFNDIAVAVKTLLHEHRATRILVLDCDVHQGDGTALMLEDEPRCFTCSIHGEHNYPQTKQRSDLDVSLPRGTEDAEYLLALDKTLAQLALLPPFDLLIYDGGSDVHRDDRLGQMNLSDAGIRNRDQRVIDWAQQRRLPTACLIGGGYDHDHPRLARRHSLLIETADRCYRHWGQASVT
jgi:acetoin utilization deacetylase AcuC-like enzyme